MEKWVDPTKEQQKLSIERHGFKADLKRKTTLHKVESSRRATRRRKQLGGGISLKQPGAFRRQESNIRALKRMPAGVLGFDPVSHGGLWPVFTLGAPRERDGCKTPLSLCSVGQREGKMRQILALLKDFFLKDSKRKMGSTWMRLLSFHIRCPLGKGGAVCDLTGH